MQEIEAIAAAGNAEQAWESTHENELKSNAEKIVDFVFWRLTDVSGIGDKDEEVATQTNLNCIKTSLYSV